MGNRAIALALGLAPSSGLTATVQLLQYSDPAGVFETTTFHETAVQGTSVAAPITAPGLRFTHWTLNGPTGSRQTDLAGRSANPFGFTIYENTEAVAHYISDSADADADSLRDWYEIEFFGDLGQGPSSDPDLDGFSVSAEQFRGYHPNLPDGLAEGGVAARNSEGVLLIIGTNYVWLHENSAPAGIVTNDRIVTNETVVALSPAPEATSGFRLVGWHVGGQRVGDGTTRQPVSLLISGETTATARYVNELEDADLDGFLDWQEWLYFGDLDETTATDPDADGFSNSVELFRGYHPGVRDAVSQGGVANRSSSPVVIDIANFATYALLSDPMGIFSVEETVARGSTVTTPDLWGQTNAGYRFAFWEFGGQRVTGDFGISRGSFSFVIESNATATAHYLPTNQDGDLDGLPDWYEQNYFGSLSNSATSDVDTDGFSVGAEMARNYSPVAPDNLFEGGVANRSSGPIAVDLQPFERLRFILREGVLEEFFSMDPYVPTGWDFGDNSAPAAGDWDGDNDPDWFIASSGGLSVFENTGSRFTPDLADRSGAFSSLSSRVFATPGASISCGDWDGDGDADLALGGDTNVVALFASRGDFSGSQPGEPASTLIVTGMRALPALDDVDGDGHCDLLVLLDDGSVQLHVGGGSSFGASPDTVNLLGVLVPNAVGIACADINDDGLTDVLVSDAEGRIWEFIATAGGDFALKSKVWAGAGAGFAPRLTIAGVDLDGDLDADVLCGTANGALVGLRDPRVGRPSGLKASPGANSVLLTWDPNHQSRIRGYFSYRSAASGGGFDRLNALAIPEPSYLDGSPVHGVTNFYQVTAATEFFFPGNSSGTILESAPSDVAFACPGTVVLRLSDSFGKPGGKVNVRLEIENSLDLSASGFRVGVGYDPSLLIPVTQVDAGEPTAKRAGLSRDMLLSDNGATASGGLVVTATGGALRAGDGRLLELDFRVRDTASPGSGCSMTILEAVLFDLGGSLVGTATTSPGYFTVKANHGRGDVNGDGRVDEADKQRIKDFLKGLFSLSPEERAAADLNGNGKIGPEDLQLLLRLLLGLPISEP